MGAHIFLVGEENFDVCIERGVYGCVMPSKEWNRGEIVSGILSIQTGDLVFFYVKNKGVYGLWKVIGEPFFDETRIWPSKEQTFPYRFSFEAAVGQFEKPISLNDVLDLHDKGRIWTFDLNPVQQKNQYKITMDEARELQSRLTPLANAVTTKYGIGGLKVAMDLAGYFGGDPRPPLKRPGKEVEEELKRLLLRFKNVEVKGSKK
jgi:hypothetical protein